MVKYVDAGSWRFLEANDGTCYWQLNWSASGVTSVFGGLPGPEWLRVREERIAMIDHLGMSITTALANERSLVTVADTYVGAVESADASSAYAWRGPFGPIRPENDGTQGLVTAYDGYSEWSGNVTVSVVACGRFIPIRRADALPVSVERMRVFPWERK